VEKAEDLAEWILGSQSGWVRDRVTRFVQGSQTVGVKLMHPIQIVTIYVTAMVLESGEVNFSEDIYGEDANFEKQLSAAASRLSLRR
jgi:murein L,D-transpeptidase YcbB/YkuD